MAVIDIEVLLQPISDVEPSGSDIRSSPQYLQIIDAMREDDPFIQREAWEEVRVADWAKVQQLCEQLLETKSKDLQLAVWLCEALLRNHGIAGFVDGLLLLVELCRVYWDTLYPTLDDPNVLYRRTNVLTKFFGKLDLHLRHIVVTAPQDAELHVYRWGDYLDASHIDRLDELDKHRAIEQGRATTDMFTASLRDTADEFYMQLGEQVILTVSLVDELESLIQQQCEQLRPLLDEQSDADFSLGLAKESLALLQQFVRRIYHDRGIGAEQADTTVEKMADEQRPKELLSMTGPFKGREEAYRALEQIADYLSRIEPHSPVPYLLWRAVKWGKLSAQEILEELYQNAPDLEQLYRLLGLQPPDTQQSQW